MADAMRTQLTVTGDASSVVGALKQAEDALEGTRRASKGLEGGLDQLARTADNAANKTSRPAVSAQRSMDEAAAKFKYHQSELRTEFYALKSSIDPVYRIEQQFAAAQKIVNDALENGAVEAGEAADMLRQLETQYERARAEAASFDAASGSASNNVSDLNDKVATGAENFAEIAGSIADGSASAEGLIRQLPLIAGGFGLIGTLAGQAAVVGAELFLKWREGADSARTLEEINQDLDKSLGDVAENMRRLRDPDLDTIFGSMTEDARELLGVLTELGRTTSIADLRAALKATTEEAIEPGKFVTGLRQGLYAANPFANPWAPPPTLEGARRENFDALGAGIGYDQFSRRQGQIMDLVQAGDIEQAVARITSLVKDLKGEQPFTEMNEDLKNMIDGLSDLAIGMAETGAQINQTAQSGKEMDEAAREFYQRQSEATKLAAEIEESEQRKLDLAQAEAQYGAESAEVQAMKVEQTRAELDERMALANINEEDRARILDIYDQTAAVTAQTADWADTMAGVRAEITAILGALASLGGGVVANTAKRAELDALKAGKSVAEAARARQKLLSDTELNVRAMAAKSPVEKWLIEAERKQRDSGYALDDEISTARDAARKRDRKSTGARSGGRKKTARKGRKAGGARSGGRSAISKSQREYDRLTKEITREMDKVQPSYDRDIAEAKKWRDETLAGLKKTKAGYDQFAGDVEAIYRDRLKKAYDEDLQRRTDWNAGIERGLRDMRDSTRTWADTSEDIIEGFTTQGAEWFSEFARTGKLSIDDLVDHTLDTMLQMAFEMTVQPAIGQLLGGVLGSVGSIFGGTTVKTAHTGDTGVMRTYSRGNSPRKGERLTMIRDGEKVFTPRMLENGAAIVDALSQAAAGSGESPGTAPIINIVNNSSAQVTGRIEEDAPQRGQRQFRLMMDDAVADAIRRPGGRTQKSMNSTFGASPKGIAR